MSNFTGYNSKLRIGNKEFDVISWEVNAPTIKYKEDFFNFGNFSGLNYKIEAINAYPEEAFELIIYEDSEEFYFHKEDKYVEYDKSDWWWLEKYGYGTIEKRNSKNIFTTKRFRIIIQDDTEHIKSEFFEKQIRYSLRSYT